jgi:hypothetical protein
MIVGNCVYCTRVTFSDNNVYTFCKDRAIRNLMEKTLLRIYMLHENKTNHVLKNRQKIHRIQEKLKISVSSIPQSNKHCSHQEHMGEFNLECTSRYWIKGIGVRVRNVLPVLSSVQRLVGMPTATSKGMCISPTATVLCN